MPLTLTTSPPDSMRRLDLAAWNTIAPTLPQWQFRDERGGLIEREFVFEDFVQAFGFMAQIALVAERLGHHPEWTNVYNRVGITLTTHDLDGLSTNDVDFALMADRIHASCPQPARHDAGGK
jgi:4a-hydroxytetrahydrobiopterin dehydratase